MSVKLIIKHIVRCASLMIRNKIYFTNSDNSVLATLINVVYEMVIKNSDYNVSNPKRTIYRKYKGNARKEEQVQIGNPNTMYPI